MVTYLVGTDGVAASEALHDFLREDVDEGDRIEVVNVLKGSDVDAANEGKAALEVFEEAFGESVTVNVRQLHRGNAPAVELLNIAQEVDADRIVTGLRQHSRTERIIFGSVSQSLLQQTDRPVTLVPLPEYTLDDG